MPTPPPHTACSSANGAEERGPGIGVCAAPTVEPAGVLGGDGQQCGHHGEEHQHSLDGEEARVDRLRIAVYSQRTFDEPGDAWRCTLFCVVIDELPSVKALFGSIGELRGQPFQGAFHIGTGAPGEAHQPQQPLVPHPARVPGFADHGS